MTAYVIDAFKNEEARPNVLRDLNRLDTLPCGSSDPLATETALGGGMTRRGRLAFGRRSAQFQ